MAAPLPYIQPYWSQAEFSQLGWSNVYHPEQRLSIQQYDSTTNCAAEEVAAGYEQEKGVPCPDDWYLDNAGSRQTLQSLPSFQVLFHCMFGGWETRNSRQLFVAAACWFSACAKQRQRDCPKSFGNRLHYINNTHLTALCTLCEPVSERSNQSGFTEARE